MSDTLQTAEAGEKGPSKSALKKAKKLADSQAMKAAKKIAGPASTPAQAGAGPSARKAAKAEKVVEEVIVQDVPLGQKKDMSLPMANSYHPLAVEAGWQAWWEAKKFFKPAERAADATTPEETFVIPAPPPNITGALHCGHALTISLQDCMIRFERARGKTTLFVPGFDHASISTQSVVEKKLWKEEGKTRHDIGREALLVKLFDWSELHKDKITNQLRRLGASYDWDRVAFTMDKNLSEAVTETFCRLHENGVIYRGKRIVNWCCAMNTSLSNIECDELEIKGRTLLNVPGYDASERIEYGVITSFKYPIEGSDETITVATTRPETMLGDTGIAVHPDDARYTHLIGKFATHPFIEGLRLPIFADAETVELGFGTGAVKITPGHDPNDFLTGQRHNLQIINLMNDDGTYNENAGKYAGLKRLSLRRIIVDDLKKAGLFVETKDNPMVLQICNKSKDIIEPILKPQWWVKCSAMADDVIKRTRSGELAIKPDYMLDSWYQWFGNMQDWCISRQLWWGHQCPAYFVEIEGAQQEDVDENWVVGRNMSEVNERAAKLANGRKYTIRQDPDIFDTWFSSGLWPFSIMGWPKKTEDFERFYPNTVLETGGDIIFFWVARMAMLGTYLTGKMPFKEVFFHGMVLDGEFRKMSKSLGNVIDPLEVIDGITLEKMLDALKEGNLPPNEVKRASAAKQKEFPTGLPATGTDALRIGFCSMTSSLPHMPFDFKRMEGYRKFGNKIWNATKFCMMNFPSDFVPAETVKATGRESLAEQWILDRLNTATRQVTSYLETRNFQLAVNAVHNFWLYEFCDVYIEASKAIIEHSKDSESKMSALNTLYTSMESGLRLLHPFMPFITEELWQRLPRRPSSRFESITQESWPITSTDREYVTARQDFDLVFKTLQTARSLAAQYRLTSNVQLYISAQDRLAPMMESQKHILSSLIKGCETLSVLSSQEKVPEGCTLGVVSSEVKVHLLIKGLVDVDAESAKVRKRIEVAKVNLETTTRQTQAQGYTTNVPQELQDITSKKIGDLEQEIASLEQALSDFVKIAA